MDESALKLQSGEEDVLDVTEGSLSQWQLIRLRFRKHRLAVVSLYVLVVLYSMALFAEFFAPYTQSWKNLSYAYCPPTTPSFPLKHGFYTYALKLRVDPITLRKYYIEDRDDVFPLGFFVKGVPYKLFGLIPAERHFVDVDLSLLNWTGLARVVRGKILALREEDCALAARLLGANHGRIIFRHLLPGFTSHIIVTLTLSVPGMILGETALSFLGLGLRLPVVSWGVMLQDCLNLQVVANYPWLLMPVIMIIMTVLSFNRSGFNSPKLASYLQF